MTEQFEQPTDDDSEITLPDGMRFEGDLMGFWHYNDAREPKYTQPAEFAQLLKIAEAVEALKALGWREAIYCPKDGTRFLAVEAGCTAVYPCSYRGTWPDGHWWIYHAGDAWPARPILFRPMREPEEDAPEQIALEAAQKAEEAHSAAGVAHSPTPAAKRARISAGVRKLGKVEGGSPR